MGEDAIDVADAERTEHQDPPAIAGLAQFDALLDVGHGEPLGAGLAQRPGDGYGAVAVGVGLYYGEDAGRVAGPAAARRLRSASRAR